jgi:hypothetical protein
MALRIMYEQCKVTAEDLVSKQRKSNKSFDLTPLDGRVPRCIEWLIENKYTKSEWNDKAMQLTAYIQTAGLDDELLQAAAENHRGDSGDTPAELLSALEGKQNTVIPWRCASVNALFDRTPCPGCALNKPRQASNDDNHTPTNDVGEFALEHLLKHYALLRMDGRVHLVDASDGVQFCHIPEQKLLFENTPIFHAKQ